MKEQLQDARRTIGKSTIRDNWKTPLYLFDYVNNEFNFDADLAASDGTLCNKYFSKENSALAESNSWDDMVAWCNPPYSMNKHFLKKAAEAKGSIIVFLLPNATDTKWFHDALRAGAGFYIVEGRVQFIAPEDLDAGSNPSGSVILVFDSKDEDGYYSGYLGTINLKQIREESEINE